MSTNRSIYMLIHGQTKVGKSTAAITTPAPRLMLDAEMGHKFLPGRMIKWDPKTGPPPECDGSWDTCVVIVRDWNVVNMAYQYLLTGQHCFRSLVVDSISELQARALESIAGRGQVQTQQWGDLLRQIDFFVRDIRDLTEHPTNPLEAICMTAMTTEKEGVLKPYLQGQAAVKTPYVFDVIGYLAVEEYPYPDAPGTYQVRRLYVERTNKFEAGERVQGRLGKIVEQADLNVERMLDLIYGPKPQASPTPAPVIDLSTEGS